MKMHIDPQQLNELGDKAKEKLRGWWKPVKYEKVIDMGREYLLVEFSGEPYNMWVLEDGETQHASAKDKLLPLLSIGQMIKFLSEYDHQTLLSTWENLDWNICDALFEACKYILEKEHETK